MNEGRQTSEATQASEGRQAKEGGRRGTSSWRAKMRSPMQNHCRLGLKALTEPAVLICLLLGGAGGAGDEEGGQAKQRKQAKEGKRRKEDDMGSSPWRAKMRSPTQNHCRLGLKALTEPAVLICLFSGGAGGAVRVPGLPWVPGGCRGHCAPGSLPAPTAPPAAPRHPRHPPKTSQAKRRQANKGRQATEGRQAKKGMQANEGRQTSEATQASEGRQAKKGKLANEGRQTSEATQASELLAFRGCRGCRG